MLSDNYLRNFNDARIVSLMTKRMFIIAGLLSIQHQHTTAQLLLHPRSVLVRDFQRKARLWNLHAGKGHEMAQPIRYK